MIRPGPDAGIYGLTGSATAFITAAAVRAGAPRTVVLVLPEGEAARLTAEDIRFYLGGKQTTERPLQDDVLLYPSSDALPFSFVGLEGEVGVGRVTALYRLAEAGAPRVLVVGLDALVRKVLPKSALRRNSFSLRVGEELDRDVLLRQFVRAGYARAPLVEDVGDFSVRGFIVDVYSPLYPYPVRIEQMGDLIESIRFFDPANQRSIGDAAEIQICPVHMLVPDEIEQEHGLKLLLERCDERGTEKRVRQRLLDDFRHGVRFPGAESYLPYFFTPAESLLDYLPRESTLVLPDADTLGRALEDVEEEIYRGWESAAENGLPAPNTDELYLSGAELLRRMRDFRTVLTAALEVEDPDRISVRVPCTPNGDIRQALLKAGSYDSGMSGLVKRLQRWRDDGREVFLVSHTKGQAHRLMKLLEPYSLGLDFRGEGFDQANLDGPPTPGIRLYIGELSAGFRMKYAGRVVLTEEEIFGSRVRTAPKKRARGSALFTLTDLAEGEAVVHEDYGIGIFRGLAKKEFDGVTGEVMVIEYSGGDILYHPVERLQIVQKYVSGSAEPPRVDRLGGKGWAKTKAKVRQALRDMAKELLDLYAKRRIAERKPYSPADETFDAFEAAFEFEETPDQAAAIQDIMQSLDSDRPMDRLVCGDVGYGKTEVALRAAFRAVMEGKQVAILVPTTVLAQQHYDTVSRRFRGYPITVDMLSRFRTSAQIKEALERLREGKLDVVIGTHRLLAKDVGFRDLGLLVVDEEHRFGVAHKERIKQFKTHVDVLTLTATPIPRTLNMALSGMRDLSLIETPPPNRKSIRTHVVRLSDEVIRDAIVRELSRGGQVFYIHNRVRSIQRRAAALGTLIPEGAFGVAHGQMGDRELERVMLDFVTGKINVLVCTNIIESGLDIPRANTMIIERADTFGLADLYQLRGRVGRSNVRAYAYLLTPPETLMTPDAVKRLAVVQEHSELGQGFRIAMRDMEIRGAGSILGTSQSGHVAQVGYEMYLEILEQAIAEIKGEEQPPRIDPEIRLKVEAFIPEDCVPDPQQRMNLYKRLSRAGHESEIDGIEDEILDLYGKAPEQLANLLRIMRVRLAMKEIRATRLDYNDRDLVVTFDAETPVRPEHLVVWAQQSPQRVRLLPGDRLMFRIGALDPDQRVRKSFELLARLKEAAESGRMAPLLREGNSATIRTA